MEDNLKKINFAVGIFDGITEKIKEKVSEESKNSQFYGIGVYTNNVIKEKFQTLPINNLEERMKIAKNIEGVDFVFAIDNPQSKEIRKTIENSCKEYIKNNRGNF